MKAVKFILMVMAVSAWVNCFGTCTTVSEEDEKVKDIPVCAEWLHPDSIAYSKLGRRLSDVLMNAKSVKVYSLVPKENINSDDVEIDSHFVRDSLLGVLTKEQAVILKYALLSCGANYFNDSTLIPMTPYCPVIEFEFTKKKETAHVFISLSDFKWGVKYDGKLQFKYNYADGVYLHRLCNYFLQKDIKQEKKGGKDL